MHNYFVQIAYTDGSVSNHEMVATVERIAEIARNRKSRNGNSAAKVTIDYRGSRQVVTL